MQGSYPAFDATSSTTSRLPLIDAARGVAVAAMVVYHFSWDLRFFGYTTADVAGDLGWRLFARSIAGSFILLAGVSLVLAGRSGLNARSFLKRLALIGAAAAAITLTTFFTFPDAFIFFGILHHIAVASVIGVLFIGAPVVLTAAAAVVAFALPALAAGPAFDGPALVWLGLSTYEPRTNDFVPLFPWLGVTLSGIAAARLAPLAAPALERLRAYLEPLAIRAPALLWAGRRSLAIYLLHQPILFGLVWVAAQVSPPDLLGFEPEFVESCSRSCVAADVGAEHCQRTCQCLADQAQEEGLWTGLMREGLTEAEEVRYLALAEMCQTGSAP